MNKITYLLEKLDFKRYWKSFVVSALASFLMASLPHLGVRLNLYGEQGLFAQVVNMVTDSSLVNPRPNKVEAIEQLKPKLESKKNEFKLQKESGLISQVEAAGEYDKARAYIVVDMATGKVLAEKNSSQKLPIASITKVMTSTVALDLAKPTDEFLVSEYASKIIPTKIGVKPGQKLTVEELINAMLLTSANDASEVVKEGIDQMYGEEVMIKAMSEKAKILGLKTTHFGNAQGFDSSENYSSAEDLAVLGHYALSNYPLIYEIVQKQYEFLPKNSNHSQFDLYNWNGLLGVYPGAFGVKIGSTEDAGKTTMVGAERNGKKVLVVLLNTPGIIERDLWAAQLLDLGFEKLDNLDPVNVTEQQLKEKYATWKYW